MTQLYPWAFVQTDYTISELVPGQLVILSISSKAVQKVQILQKMLNLCYCKCNFNNEAWWSFFATSHGKFPCADVGETVKQAKIASLQRLMFDQIMIIQALFEYCCDNISAIQFELLHSYDFQKVQLKMASRFLLGSTIPRTCFFQHFELLQYLQLGTNEPAKTTTSQAFIAFCTTAENICKLLEMTI